MANTPNSSVTLEKFYQKFRNFTKLESKRWEQNDQRWEQNAKSLKKLDKKVDLIAKTLDRDLMHTTKRVAKLEKEVFGTTFPDPI